MIKFDDLAPKGEIFNMFANNKLIQELTEKMKSKMDVAIFFRFNRVGMIGQSIYDEISKDCSSMSTFRLEQLASICELYIFYIRSIYDYILNFLNKKLGRNFPSSFNSFLRRAEKDKYPQLTKEFSNLLFNGKKFFYEVKNLRDSIKNKSCSVVLSKRENALYIWVEFLSSDGSKFIINERLEDFILRHSFALFYLMAFIKQEIVD